MQRRLGREDKLEHWLPSSTQRKLQAALIPRASHLHRVYQQPVRVLGAGFGHNCLLQPVQRALQLIVPVAELGRQAGHIRRCRCWGSGRRQPEHGLLIQPPPAAKPGCWSVEHMNVQQQGVLFDSWESS
jgi:hypothetical protein